MFRIYKFFLFPIIPINFNRNFFSLTKLFLIFTILFFYVFHTARAQQEQPRIFSIAVTEGQVDPTNRTIKVLQGDEVKIQWVSDKKLILHLHGYDLTLNLMAGEPGAFIFKAYATGRYPVAIHDSDNRKNSSHHGGAVVYLEVHPR